MKLINKKTGQMVVFGEGFIDLRSIGCNNVAEFIEAGWEDYEEPKEHWCINEFGTPEMAGRFNRESIYDKSRKLVGNDFESKEEAEKALEKLKAWKRLKDKGFRFYRWNKGSLLKSLPNTIEFACDDTEIWTWKDIQDDLDLLFGGEEL